MLCGCHYNTNVNVNVHTGIVIRILYLATVMLTMEFQK